ncbi:helix-turn-helix transcriptional regulator [Bosea minatitlanensis]|uniref:Helix-turn-helix transcriptional regulator n=1 Tax=Bosea minatitlanensis TaxID=128782 RepID=A0ABW0FBA6_9HYPH|nr:helix-turn-helix transcriptional regulator [Bosea minatitlanensis]MCT4494804.1 helix-turn-helix transcriptional regulator [Bosea minatitlanensis]
MDSSMSLQFSVPSHACGRPLPARGLPASETGCTSSKAVFVIDAHLNVAFSNRGARSLSGEGLGGPDRFTAADKDFMARLQLWLKRCPAGGAPGEVRLPLSLAGGRQVAIDAVHLESIDLFVLTVDDPEAAIGRKRGQVARACGLTPTEERMLALIVEGLDTVIAARRLGIAPTTARTHLQRLFAKTGTARQSELVRFVATYVEEPR